MSDEFEGAVDIAEALDPSALDDFSGDVWSLKRRNWEITDTEVTLKNDDGDVDELSEATKVTEVISFTTEVDGRELTIIGRYFKVFPSNPDHEPPDLVQNIGRSQLALLCARTERVPDAHRTGSHPRACDTLQTWTTRVSCVPPTCFAPPGRSSCSPARA